MNTDKTPSVGERIYKLIDLLYHLIKLMLIYYYSKQLGSSVWCERNEEWKYAVQKKTLQNQQLSHNCFLQIIHQSPLGHTSIQPTIIIQSSATFHNKHKRHEGYQQKKLDIQKKQLLLPLIYEMLILCKTTKLKGSLANFLLTYTVLLH